MPFRTGHTYTVPSSSGGSKGVVNTRKRTYEGKGPAPAGTKKVATPKLSEVPTVTSSSGKVLSTSGFSSPIAATRAVRRSQAAHARVRRITKALNLTAQKPPQGLTQPAKYSPRNLRPASPYATPIVPSSKPKTFQGQRTAGTPTVAALREAAKAGTLKTNDAGFVTTPEVRRVSRQLQKVKRVAAKVQPHISGLHTRAEEEFAEAFSRASKIPPKLAGEWTLQESGGSSAGVGGEAGKHNQLGVGYPAHPTSFSESPYFNTTPRRAGRASAKWLEGKIGGEYGYKAAPSIIGISKLAKGGASEAEIRAYIEGPSGWGTGRIAQSGVTATLGNPKALKRLRRVAERDAQAVGLKGQRATTKTIAGTKRFAYPFPGWAESRTDMGKDKAYTHVGQPILALSNGKMVPVPPGEAHWEGGNGVLLKLDNAKGLPSDYVYTYEGIVPTVHPGERVHRGQLIGRGGVTGSIETGFANARGEPLAAGEYTEGAETKAGRAMAALLASVQKGKTRIPVSLLGATSVPSTSSSPGFMVTASTVNAYSQATGIPAKRISARLRSRRLSPLTIFRKLEALGVVKGKGQEAKASTPPGGVSVKQLEAKYGKAAA